MKAIVTTTPFKQDREACKKLVNMCNVVFNETGHKLGAYELELLIKKEQPNIIIAGTEKYNEKLLKLAPIKSICRVGIGLDSVPLDICQKLGIKVFYTPNAPTVAVAELTVCQILNMLRKVQNVSDDILIRDRWNRYIGRELRNCTVGIIGFGRVGKKVFEMLSGFNIKVMMINDVNSETMNYDKNKFYHYPAMCCDASKRNILTECDIITIHIPLSDGVHYNKDYITYEDLNIMKKDVRLVNMSRGGIINEDDLYKWLKENKKACAAIDTFEDEAYHGKLRELGNAYLTPHLGSCTLRSREDMEAGACYEAIKFIKHEKSINEVI